MAPDLLTRQREEIETLRERVRQLEALLLPADTGVPSEWGLTRTEARLFVHLTSRQIATIDTIMTALYGNRSGDEPDDRIVAVYLCKLRKKLSRYGVVIECIWGLGYSLRDYRSFQRKAA